MIYDVKALLKDLREIEASIGHDKEWEKLRDRICSCSRLTYNEIFELEKDVDAFFESEAPKEDKEQLMEYTESLAMIVEGILEESDDRTNR